MEPPPSVPKAKRLGPLPPVRRANRRRQSQRRSRAAMSDQDEAEPSAAPYVPTTTTTAEDTGAPGPDQPSGRQPLTGRAIIRAVTEGHSVVITILMIALPV